MSNLLEYNFPVIESDGLVSNKAATMGGAWTFNGAVTLNGTTTFSGAQVKQVYGSSGNTSPTAAQSGSTFLFDTAAGITYTLPAPIVGATYDFVVTTSVTSSNHKVITSAGTIYLQGAITSATTTASVFESVTGSTNISITMNGTTGGLVGSNFTFKCLSATLWQVSGTNFTSGTTATPFATT